MRRRAGDVAAAGIAGGAARLPAAFIRRTPRTHQDFLHVRLCSFLGGKNIILFWPPVIHILFFIF